MARDMKQILQNLKTGATEVAQLPSPRGASGQLLIRTTRTLLSVGTERMLVEFGRAGWLDKARQQPEKVRMVLEKIRTDGLLPTLDAVQSPALRFLWTRFCDNESRKECPR
jgi:hypothetical protein